jgi:transcriptional regulator with XRE-family HTH domain
MREKRKKKHGLTPFGKVVKKRLIDKGMQHQELAVAAGTTLKYLDHILYGRRKRSKYIYKIAAILDIKIEKYIA